MAASNKLEILPTISDIQRGIRQGTSKRELYRSVSLIADQSRGKDDPGSVAVREGLKRDVVMEIHNGNVAG